MRAPGIVVSPTDSVVGITPPTRVPRLLTCAVKVGNGSAIWTSATRDGLSRLRTKIYVVVTTTAEPTSVWRRVHFCDDRTEVGSEDECSLGIIVRPVAIKSLAAVLLVTMLLL